MVSASLMKLSGAQSNWRQAMAGGLLESFPEGNSLASSTSTGRRVQLLYRVLGKQTGAVGGAAGHDEDLVNISSSW